MSQIAILQLHGMNEVLDGRFLRFWTGDFCVKIFWVATDIMKYQS